MKLKRIRIGALFLALTVMFGIVGMAPSLTLGVNASTASELENKIDKLEKEQKQLEKDLKALAQDKKDEEKYQATLNKQIASMETQIDAIEEQLEVLGKNIALKEKEIETKGADIEENYERMKQRLAAMQLAGDNSLLEAIFTAESLSDLLTRAKMIQAIAERDQALLNRLSSEKRDIEAAKVEIENDKAQTEAKKKTLDSKKASLQSAYSKSKKHMEDIEKEKADYEKRKKQLDAEEAAAQKELDKLYAENQSTGTLSPGGWMFPVPGSRIYISSGYGWRWNHTQYHTGVDICMWRNSDGSSAINGKNIVASKAGKVISVVPNYGSKTGYGAYVVIDHGGGYSTLYAHCSLISVKKGDTVKQGQVIGKVGNSGNSTGPHLHFEVRIGGKHTNPMNYIKLP